MRFLVSYTCAPSTMACATLRRLDRFSTVALAVLPTMQLRSQIIVCTAEQITLVRALAPPVKVALIADLPKH